MLQKRFFIIVSLLLSTTITYSQVKFVNEFLNIGVGARAHGMFGSVAASSGDVTAGFWNPAGLTEIDAPLQFSAMHANWFGGIANYDYGGIAKRLNGGKSFASLTLIRMGIDNIPNTLNLIGPDGSVDYDRVTQFSAVDYGIIGSYATKMGEADKLSLGGSIKVIRRSIGDFGAAWGFGADFGITYKVNKQLTLAAVGKDITTTFNAWSFNISDEDKQVFAATGNDIPVSSTEIALPRFVLASAYKKELGNMSVLAELDINLSTNGTEAGVFSGDRIAVDPTFGLEIGYKDLIYLRMGLGNIQRVINAANTTDTSLEIQPNMGLGVKLGRLNVDYALTNIGSLSGVLVSNIFSVSLDFAEKKPATIP